MKDFSFSNFSFFNNKKDIEDVKEDVNIVDVLDQLKDELDISNLNLRKEIHQLTKYFNKIPFFYAILDYEGRMIRFNKSLRGAINCLESELMGKRLIEYTHPDDVNDFVKFMKYLKNKSTTSNKVITRIISKNGTLSYIRWGGINLEDDQMLLFFGQDITHEIELGDKLKKFISYKNLILDNYPGSVIATDLKGAVTEFNKTAELTTGHSKRFVINKRHIYDIFPDKDLFKENKMGEIHLTKLKRFDGQLLDAYLLLHPLLNEDEKMVGYLGIWHDQSYVNYIKESLK